MYVSLPGWQLRRTRGSLSWRLRFSVSRISPIRCGTWWSMEFANHTKRERLSGKITPVEIWMNNFVALNKILSNYESLSNEPAASRVVASIFVHYRQISRMGNVSGQQVEVVTFNVTRCTEHCVGGSYHILPGPYWNCFLFSGWFP